MFCKLIVQVATLCGIFYMHEDIPVAYKNTLTTLINHPRALSCFTKDSSPRFMTSQTHLFLLEDTEHRRSEPIELPVIYNKQFQLSSFYEQCVKKQEEAECDEEDDDEEEKTEMRAITNELFQRLQPTRNPAWPKPTPFLPARKEFLKDKLIETKKLLLSGNLSPVELKHAVRKIRVINQKIARENVKEVIQKQRNFVKTKQGMEAVIFCSKTGATGNAFQGCMQDMRLTHDKKVAANSVKVTKKALTINNKVTVPVYKSRITPTTSIKMASAIQPKASTIQPKASIAQPRIIPKSVIGKSRVCTATGDPHFTNYNGDYFHLQEPSIFVFTKSKDGLFEVQVKQDGARKVGEPSYVRDVRIRYGNNVYNSRFSADGFVVKQDGTSLSVTVPGSYEGTMMGVCGEDTPLKGVHNYKGPDGALMDVNYGKPGWEMGGYGGPNTLLSKWHLSWKPSVADCLFGMEECKINLGLASPKAASKVSTRRSG